jgi:hypothetical protein
MAFKTAFAKACFIIAAGACTTANAQGYTPKTTKVRLIVFNGALSPQEASEIANRATAAWSPFAQVSRIDYRQWRDLPQAGPDIYTRADQLYKAAAWARTKGMHRGYGVVAMVTPELLGGYLAGIALTTCASSPARSYAVVNTKPGRADTNTVALVHEAAHLMGAGHIENPLSWMHPDALNEANKNYTAVARFAPASTQQIKRCLR